MGGLRYVTGQPDAAPVRSGISLGDAVTALYAAIGTLIAVYQREKSGNNHGQMVDVALYESVFALMEGLVPEYDMFQVVRERTGSALPGIAPSNTYPTADDRYVVVAGNGDSIFRRLMGVIGRPDLAEDPRFADNPGRVSEQRYLDQVIAEWTSRHTLDRFRGLCPSCPRRLDR